MSETKKSSGLEVLVPVAPEPPPQKMAPRLATLDGKTVGFLWNGKPHGEELFLEIIEKLRTKYNVKDVVIEKKQFQGNVAPNDMFERIVERCDAAMTGFAD